MISGIGHVISGTEGRGHHRDQCHVTQRVSVLWWAEDVVGGARTLGGCQAMRGRGQELVEGGHC